MGGGGWDVQLGYFSNRTECNVINQLSFIFNEFVLSNNFSQQYLEDSYIPLFTLIYQGTVGVAAIEV